MSDDLSQMELVSSFMDGETGELPEGLCRDKAARTCWRRYHMIREVLRDSKPACLSGDFNARLTEALEKEPTVIAPRLIKHRNTVTRRMLRPAAGLAIAATVAAVAVIGFQNVYAPGPVSQPRLAGTATPPAKPRDFELADAPVSRPSPVNQRTLVSARGGVGVEDERHVGTNEDSLNGYLLEHMEQSTGGHTPSMLPYVRLAGYESTR